MRNRLEKPPLVTDRSEITACIFRVPWALDIPTATMCDEASRDLPVIRWVDGIRMVVLPIHRQLLANDRVQTVRLQTGTLESWPTERPGMT